MPTPFHEINAVLSTLEAEVSGLLGSAVAGMYLCGSLALGDFDDSSDIDVLVATVETLPGRCVRALAEMHERLSTCYPRWGSEVEVSYVPLAALRRYSPTRDVHPYIGRGERLRLEKHGREWDTHRHVVREHGVALSGPAPRTLIDPVGPDGLRLAVLETLRESWPHRLTNAATLYPRGYRSYLVLTGCRMLYTLEHGCVVSKPTAARWAQAALDPGWSSLIEWAVEARREPTLKSLDNLNEAMEFIRYVIDRGRRTDGTSA